MRQNPFPLLIIICSLVIIGAFFYTWIIIDVSTNNLETLLPEKWVKKTASFEHYEELSGFQIPRRMKDEDIQNILANIEFFSSLTKTVKKGEVFSGLKNLGKKSYATYTLPLLAVISIVFAALWKVFPVGRWLILILNGATGGYGINKLISLNASIAVLKIGTALWLSFYLFLSVALFALLGLLIRTPRPNFCCPIGPVL